ncbi:hypothetical protein BFJ69_g8570 [Fusarium oxysporum]|uniref:Uncharacterized protein n=1 Tax=Fusarium oxysporum TaxID=5507 RepID=A0A420N1W4_FUSOX|nr:hypothetical protein BFJ69_g8570 [Fusarium oxysporum]
MSRKKRSDGNHRSRNRLLLEFVGLYEARGGLLSGKETTKAFGNAIKDGPKQESKSVLVNLIRGKLLTEADDDDEIDEPNFTIEDALTEVLDDLVHNNGATYASVEDLVTQELGAVYDKSKFYMQEESNKDMEEEKTSKPVDEITEIKYEVVNACVDMWNSISEQKIMNGVAQTRHFLLQMISANDSEFDGVVRAYEWP